MFTGFSVSFESDAGYGQFSFNRRIPAPQPTDFQPPPPTPDISSFGALGGDMPVNSNPHVDPPRASAKKLGDGHLIQLVIDNADKLVALAQLLKGLFSK